MMKLLSTTGALLAEKNIAFDINPTGGELKDQDELVGVVSNPNPEEMLIMLLTKRGKVIKYSIQLERQFDASQLVRGGSNDNDSASNSTAETPETSDNSSESKLIENKLTKGEKKKLKQAQIQQNVLYEYVISDQDTTIDDINQLRKSNATEISSEFENYTYSNLLFFYVKGRKHLVFVQNEEKLVIFDMKKKRITELDLEACGASGKIRSI